MSDEALKRTRIPIAGPWITNLEVEYVAQAAADGWYDNAGKYQSEFEQAFALLTGRRHAIALPSCTSGLHLALLALGIGPGDEVVVPDVTWIATSAPVSYVGATPLFADVDPNSWCITADALKAIVTPRTKAVIVVDLYGNMPDLDPILTFCRERNIAVIEDAAEAAGANYNGRLAGSFGDFSAFSFHGSKTLTTGEGGMLLVDDETYWNRCLALRDHGRAPGDKMFWNDQIAHKYRMSAMQAALGTVQLRRLPELIARKRAIFSWYYQGLGNVPGIRLNREAAGVFNAYWMVTAILDPKLGWTKEDLIKALGQRGVDCRPFFYPLSMLPAYQPFASATEARARNAVSYSISPYGINLPSALSVTEDQVAQAAGELKKLAHNK